MRDQYYNIILYTRVLGSRDAINVNITLWARVFAIKLIIIRTRVEGVLQCLLWYVFGHTKNRYTIMFINLSSVLSRHC